MVLRLKKQNDTPVGTIVSSTKSLITKPNESSSEGERWLLCDGSTLSILTNPEYTALWYVIGTKYGGTSAIDFKLPALCDPTLASTVGLLPADSTAKVLRGHDDFSNFPNVATGGADETTSRTNTGSGTLTSNTDSLSGQFNTQLQSNFSAIALSGAPGVQVNRNTANHALTLRQIPAHNHQTQTIPRNRNSDGGWVQSTDGGQQRGRVAYRAWYWGESGTAGGGTNAAADGHSHRASITPGNVSGNANIVSNYAAAITHNLTAQFNGSPSDASLVNKRAEVLYYIKY